MAATREAALDLVAEIIDRGLRRREKSQKTTNGRPSTRKAPAVKDSEHGGTRARVSD